MARMLIIDDKESPRKLLHAVLTQKRHDVFLAVNGQKGVNLFDRTRPAITLVSARLPDMTGLEVLGRLRGIEPHAYVIVLADSAAEEEAALAIHGGANDVLKRGFSLYEFGRALRLASLPAEKSRAGRRSLISGTGDSERQSCRAY